MGSMLSHLLDRLKVKPMTRPSLKLSFFEKFFETESVYLQNSGKYLSTKPQI